MYNNTSANNYPQAQPGYPQPHMGGYPPQPGYHPGSQGGYPTSPPGVYPPSSYPAAQQAPKRLDPDHMPSPVGLLLFII